MKSSFTEWSESDVDDEEKEPTRTRIQRKGIGVIEMDYYEDHTDVWCPHCKECGFRVKLGPKILMPNEQRQPDYENWLECPDYHEIVASYVIEHDATIIRDAVETVESPFENQTEIMGIPKRSFTSRSKSSSEEKPK